MKKVAKSHRAVPAKPPKKGGSTKPFFQKKGNATIGNKSDAFFQPKLKVNEPNDKFEKEADHVADQVTSGKTLESPGVYQQITPIAQRKAEVEEEENVQAKNEEEEEAIQMKEGEEEENVQMKGEEETEDTVQMQSEEEEEMQMKEEEETVQAKRKKPRVANIEKPLKASKGLGSPMKEGIRMEMENSFGVDFSEVKIHTDNSSIQMNKAINAKAFTHKNDIYFNKGNYDPSSKSGKWLLAHELTHVVQQKGAKANETIISRSAEGKANPQSASPDKEKTFEQNGLELYNLIQQKLSQLPKEIQKLFKRSLSKGGDSTSLNVYNEWFDQLQTLLIALDFWGEPEQAAQELLVEYATYRTAIQLGGIEKIPGNVLYLLSRIGLSERNDKAILKYNKQLNKELGPGNEVELPRTGSDFRAPEGSRDWCAQAQTFALKNSGLVKGKARAYQEGEQLLQGDILSIITSKGPASGHVVCVINHKGDRLDVVSGNAGGGGGSVRIDSVTIVQPPAGYNWNAVIVAKNAGKVYNRTRTNPEKDGTIWIINITPIKDLENDLPRQAPIFGPDELGEISEESVYGDPEVETNPASTPADTLDASEPAEGATDMDGTGDLTVEEGLEEVPVEEDIMADIPPEGKVVKEEVAEVEEVKLEGNAEEMTGSFIGASPSQMANSHSALGGALNKQLKTDKDKEVKEAPVLKAQTSGKVDEGITPADELVPAEEVNFDHQPEQTPPKPTLPDHLNKGKVPDSKKLNKDLERQEEGSFVDWFKSKFSNFFNKIETKDEGVNTDAGARPKVDTSGDADIAQTEDLQKKSNEEVGKEKDSTIESLKNNPGQTNIKPQKVDEACEVQLPEEETENIVTEEKQVLVDYAQAPLPSDVREQADGMLAPNLDQNLNESKNKIDSAAQNREDQKKQEYDHAEQETAKLNQGAEEEQKNIVLDNRKKVADQQKEGMKEAQDQVKEFDKEASDEKKKVKSDVEGKIKTSEESADGELKKGEKKAEDKKIAEEKKAADKKKELEKEKENQGFWSRVASAIKSAVKAITDAITTIFKVLREAVTSIINAAKELALEFIEAARSFIVDKLNDFRKWAKEKVNKYLANFPALANKINGLIDAAVDVAIEGVNKAAEALKEGVKALADGLTKALNKILDIFETALTAAVQIVGAVLTGDFAGALRIAIEAACKIAGIDPKTIFDFLDRAKERIMDILKDPVKFFGFLVKGVGDGIKSFGKNIKKHLINGLIGWLTGALSSIAIKIPEKFNPMGIFSMVMSMIGMTYENLKARIIKRFPKAEKVFEFVETGIEFIQDYLKRGMVAVWDRVKSALSNIKELVMGGIRSFIQSSVIKAGITWLLSLTNPAGAIVKVVKMLYDFVMFLIERFNQIKDFVLSIYNTLSAIASGNLSIVVKGIEAAMSKSIPVFISLFASLLGLGNIAKQVKAIITKVTKPIHNFIDKIINKVVEWVKKFLKGGKKMLGKVKDKVLNWWKSKKKFKAKDGKSHKLYFKGEGKNAKLMVASDPIPVKTYLKGLKKNNKDDRDLSAKIVKAQKAEEKIQTITRKKVEPKDAKLITGHVTELSSSMGEIMGVTDIDLPKPANWKFKGGIKKSASVELLSSETSKGGVESTSGKTPNGFGLLQKHKLTKPGSGQWVRMHMITAAVGGTNSESNLLPTPHTVNTGAQVKSFEDALKRLLGEKDDTTKQPNVLWVKTQVKRFYPEKTTPPVPYGKTDFPNKLLMQSGMYFLTPDGWRKDPKAIISEKVEILNPPDFSLASKVSLSAAGEPDIARITGCSAPFAREISKEALKNKKYKSIGDFEVRMEDWWDKELNTKKGNPFYNNLDKVADALFRGDIML